MQRPTFLATDTNALPKKPQINIFTHAKKRLFKVKSNRTFLSAKLKLSKLGSKTKQDVENLTKEIESVEKNNDRSLNLLRKRDWLKAIREKIKHKSASPETEIYDTSSSSTIGNECASLFFADDSDCHSMGSLSTQSSYYTAESTPEMLELESMNLAFTSTATTAASICRISAECNCGKEKLVFDSPSTNETKVSDTLSTTSSTKKQHIRPFFSKTRLKSFVKKFEKEMMAVMLMHALGIILLSLFVVQKVEQSLKSIQQLIKFLGTKLL
ncbi:hypothetical protein ACO0QE_002080 [Hanseniaspora vineae]